MTRHGFALHNAFLLLLVAVVIVCLLNTTVPAEREWVKFLLDWHEEISVSKQTSVLLYIVDFHVVRINCSIEQNM